MSHHNVHRQLQAALAEGKTLDIDASGLQIGGTAITSTAAELNILDGVTATAAEINQAVDQSAQVIAAGAALTITAAHHNTTVLLDTAAGSTITLPAATGTGLKVTFVVSVTPTSNQHRINVTGDDEFVGVISISQDAGDTALHFNADAAADNDRINMNGTTQGGRIGDWLVVQDIIADSWHVRGFLNGSGAEVTPLATGAVA